MNPEGPHGLEPGGRIWFSSVQLNEEQQRWHVACEHETGFRTLYTFPLDTMEWRAAEYGLDPSDTATLLDIVMAEPFMTMEDWRQGSHIYGAHGVHSKDQAEARDHHIARTVRVKLRHRISTRGVGHVLNRVANESPLRPMALDLKTQAVYRHVVASRKNSVDTEEHQMNRLARMAAHNRLASIPLDYQPTRGDL